MPVITDQQVANIALGVGFTGPDLVTAVAVALAESRGDTQAQHTNTNGTTDYGLWQINSVHFKPGGLLAGKTPADMLDGVSNGTAARVIFAAQGWRAWTAHNNGSYLLYVPRARAVASGASAEGNVVNPDTDTPLETLVETIQSPFAWLGNPHNWVRIAQTIIGGGLIVVGILAVTNTTSLGKSVGRIRP